MREGLVVEFHALKSFSVPLTGLHGGVGLGDFAGEGQEHREGQLGGGDGVPAGSVHHHDTPLGGGFDIDIVHAHSGAADHFQFGRGFHHLAGDFGLGTDHDGHGFGDEGNEFGFGQTLVEHGDFEFRPLLEQGNALGRNWVANQYIHINQLLSRVF